MPRRPTFWIHRTRRFWFGLLLVVLVVLTIAASNVEVYAERYASCPEPDGTISETSHELGFRDGCLYLSRSTLGAWRMHHPAHASGGPSSDWSVEARQHYGFRALPSFESSAVGEFEVYLPGTLLVGLACLGWLLWMCRAERRERELYEDDR